MANAPRRARSAAEGPDRGAGPCERPGQAGRADRLHHLLGATAGKRRSDPRLSRAPSGVFGSAAGADRKRAVGQGRGFCQGRAAIAGRLADDPAADWYGWVFCVGFDPEGLNLLRHARPCAGPPRLGFAQARKTWMAGTSPAMTRGVIQSTIKIFAPVLVDERCAAS